MSMFGKGNIKNNKISARRARDIASDDQSYVRPPVLAMLRDKIGNEKYYLFLRNTPKAERETEAAKFIIEAQEQEGIE